MRGRGSEARSGTREASMRAVETIIRGVMLTGNAGPLQAKGRSSGAMSKRATKNYFRGANGTRGRWSRGTKQKRRRTKGGQIRIQSKTTPGPRGRRKR